MLGRGPAAAAHQADAALHEPARVRRHVFRRRQVDVAAFDVTRLAGVWLRRQAAIRRAAHPLDRLEHRRGADAAVDADDGHAFAVQLRHELLRRRAVEAVAVLLGRHLRDDGQIADRAHGGNRRADLVHVTERLEDEQVHAAFDERFGLLPEARLRLVDAEPAPGLDADAERSDCAGDVDGVARGLTRDARAGGVDVAELVAEAEGVQLDAVGAERVRLDNVGARADVFLVDLAHQVGLRRHHLKAQRHEVSGDHDSGWFVSVTNTYKDLAGFGQAVTGRQLRLHKCFAESRPYAHHLTGRFHLRPQDGVGARET